MTVNSNQRDAADAAVVWAVANGIGEWRATTGGAGIEPEALGEGDPRLSAGGSTPPRRCSHSRRSADTRPGAASDEPKDRDELLRRLRTERSDLPGRRAEAPPTSTFTTQAACRGAAIRSGSQVGRPVSPSGCIPRARRGDTPTFSERNCPGTGRGSSTFCASARRGFGGPGRPEVPRRRRHAAAPRRGRGSGFISTVGGRQPLPYRPTSETTRSNGPRLGAGRRLGEQPAALVPTRQRDLEHHGAATAAQFRRRTIGCAGTAPHTSTRSSTSSPSAASKVSPAEIRFSSWQLDHELAFGHGHDGLGNRIASSNPRMMSRPTRSICSLPFPGGRS